MQASERIEQTLQRAVALAQGAGPAAARGGSPLCGLSRRASHPTAAMSRGGEGVRRRPSRGRRPPLPRIELLHCASLVHDDLPCFDDADTRRGKPSVHAQFGAPIAVLAGDALIVIAFETLAREAAARPGRLALLVRSSPLRSARPAASSLGKPGNAKPAIPLADYQRAKTGALFVGSTLAGAAAAGADPEPWRMLGEKLGEAYQVADDLRDVLCDAERTRKADRPGRQALSAERRRAARDRRRKGPARGLGQGSDGLHPAVPRPLRAMRALIKAQTTSASFRKSSPRAAAWRDRAPMAALSIGSRLPGRPDRGPVQDLAQPA